MKILETKIVDGQTLRRLQCGKCNRATTWTTKSKLACSCGRPSKDEMTEEYIADLPEDSRRLLGDRIKELTDALGIPQCGGCEARQKWLNKADAWIRSMWG